MRRIGASIVVGALVTAVAIGPMAHTAGAQTNGEGSEAAEALESIPGASYNFYLDAIETTLAPAGPLRERIATSLTDLRPRVGIEVTVPIAVADRAFTADGRLELYNVLRSVSTMAGIEYFSASRGEMRTFYAESYAIVDGSDQTRTADPLVATIPMSDTIWAFQRDLSFGRNVQRISYERRGAATLMTMTNESTMVYRVVPLVSPGNLRVHIIVEERPDDGVLTFYGNVGVRVPTLLGLADRARDSFTNRIVALHGWFVGELQEAGLTR